MAGGGPSTLILAIKLDNRNTTYLSNAIYGGAEVVAANAVRQNRHKARRAIKGIIEILRAVSAGTITANLLVGVSGDATTPTPPVVTIACTQANAATDTVTFTFGNKTVVLTEGTDFARGASDTTCATALAAAVNANTTLSGLYAATSSTGTVTLTHKFSGGILRAINVTTNDATAFAITQTSFGTGVTADTFLNSLYVSKSV